MSAAVHHIELWVPDIGTAVRGWGWILGRLGWSDYQDWPGGHSWKSGSVYLVVEQSPDLNGMVHDRHRPGLNHLALNATSREQVDAIVATRPPTAGG